MVDKNGVKSGKNQLNTYFETPYSVRNLIMTYYKYWE